MKLKETTKNFYLSDPWLKTILIFVLLLAVASYSNLRTDRIFDPDSFYHISYAKYLSEHNIFNTDFPWTYYSIIRTNSADLWYGFHILLIPFTKISASQAWNIKLAGVFITFTMLVSCYFAFKNMKIKFPVLFVIFLIFSSSPMLFRMSMTRPHPLSLGFVALIFSFFNSGPIWPVFLFSLLLSWFHSSFFWFPIATIGPLALFKWLNKEKIRIDKIIAVIAGLAGGLLARPHPIGNLKLVYAQIVDIYLLKGYELAGLIGNELGIPTWVGLGKVMWPLFVSIIASIIIISVMVYKKFEFPKETKILIASSFIMFFFSINMYITATRAIDLLSLFTIMFFAIVLSFYLSQMEKSGQKIYLEAKAIFFCAMIPIITFSAYNALPRFERFFASSMLPDRFKGPALWMKDNTEKGSVVFHLYFDQFPSLFFWNQNNYYSYGMDPVFFYQYDTRLYWEMYYLAVNDAGDETCNVEDCKESDIIPTYDAIAKDFKADYVFARRQQNPSFLKYLESNPKYFQKVYDQELSVVFKVLPGKNLKK